MMMMVMMMIQYVQLDNSCTRTACSCTGVQIVSSHILTDVTVAVTKKLRGRVPLGPHGCCAYATVVVLHCVTGVTGQSGSTPLPPKNFLLGSRRIPWPGRNAGLGLGGTCPPCPPWLYTPLKLTTWSEKWQMLFNTSKCKVIHIGKSQKKYPYYMNNQQLAEVTRKKDLGILISNDLKVSQSVNQLVPKQ